MRLRIVACMMIAACGDDTVMITAPDPVLLGEAKAVVMLLFWPDGSSTVAATDRDPSAAFRWRFTDEEHDTSTAELLAVAYSCDLRALGLDPGIQELLPAPRGRSLPDGALFRSTMDGGETTTWSPVESDQRLEQIRIEGSEEDACAAFEVTTHLVPEMREAANVFRVSSQSVVVIAEFATRRTEVGLDGIIATSTETPRAVAGYRMPDGETWLLDEDGTLFSDKGGAFVARTATDAVESVSMGWLAGPERADEPFELFVFSDRGKLGRYDGQRWTALLSRDGSWANSDGTLIRTAPQRAVVAHYWYRNEGVLFTDQDQVAFERPPLVEEDFLRSGSSDRDRVLFGSHHGHVYARSESGWQELGVFLELPITGVLPFRDGALVLQKNGHVIQILDGGTTCEPWVLADGRYHQMGRMNETTYYLLASDNDETEVWITFLETERTTPCNGL